MKQVYFQYARNETDMRLCKVARYNRKYVLHKLKYLYTRIRLVRLDGLA